MKREQKSRVGIKIGAMVVQMAVILLLTNSCVAQVAGKQYVLRQEHSRIDGVLVSKPSYLDEKILNFMNINKIRTLDDYIQWLAVNMGYKQDGIIDTWSDPLEIIQKKEGDCEDFSFLNAAVLRVLGYKPRFLAFVTGDKGHAVCLFEMNGQYVYFDNAKFKTTNTGSITEFAAQVTQKYVYNRVLELNFDTQQWDILYLET